MPNTTHDLAKRRHRLGLPDTVPGTHVPVTDEVCAFIERIGEHTSATWSFHPTRHPRHGAELHLHPPGHPLVSGLIVSFDQDGAWTSVKDHVDAIHEHQWVRDNEPDATERVLGYYGTHTRNAWYASAISRLPSPPQWARDIRAAKAAEWQAKAERAQAAKAAKLAEQRREYAISEATRALQAAHQDEFNDLVEQFAAMAALSGPQPALPATTPNSHFPTA